jgi:hypothetical protein
VRRITAPRAEKGSYTGLQKEGSMSATTKAALITLMLGSLTFAFAAAALPG